MIHSIPTRRDGRRQRPTLLAVLDRLGAPKSWLISHAFPTLIAMLASIRWYEPGTYIAAGDVTPFIRDNSAQELTSLWNHQLSGAGSTSTEITRLFEVVLLWVVNALGGSNILAQEIFFTVGFGFAAFGAAHLARVVVRSRGAIAVAGLIGAFNPLILHQLPNPLFMIAIGTVGVGLGELLGHLSGRPTSVRRLVAATLPLGYLAANPALLALLTVSFISAVVVAARFVPRPRLRSLGRLLLFALPWVIGLHIWWVVPTLYVTALGVEGASFSFVSSADQWSWSHGENSIDNLLTLTAHWAWNIEYIFPWAEKLDRFPGSLTRWVLPLGAFAAPFVCHPRAKRLAWTLVGLVALTVFVSKGLHAPFAGANRWLYSNVPGYWLLREPVSKMGPLQVLLYSTLFALTIERLVDASPLTVMAPSPVPANDQRELMVDAPISTGRQAPVAQFLAAGMVLAVVAFPWPLLSGSVISDDRGPLQSMHVAVPEEWSTIAELINTSKVEGKVLVLPANYFYQVTTTWGYHGADSVPQQLLDRPMIQRFPGGYFGLSPGFGATLARIESELVYGSPEIAVRLMDSLGVSHVIHRYDVIPGAVNAELADNGFLEMGLSAAQDLVRIADTDVAVVYERRASPGVIQPATRTLITHGDADDVAEAVGRLDAGEVLIDDASLADAVAWMSESTLDLFPFEIDQTETYEVLSAPGPRTVMASARPVDDQWILTLDDASEIRLDGVMLPSADPVETLLSGEPLAVAVNGDLDVFEQDLGITIDLAEPVEVLTATGASDLIDFNTMGDCRNEKARSSEHLVLSARQDGNGGVRLAANDHSACISVDLPQRDGPAVVEFEYRTGNDDSGRFCLWDLTSKQCVIDERLEFSPDWQQIRGATDLDGTHVYQLYLYANTHSGREVSVDYRELEFLPLVAEKVWLEPELGTSVELDEGSHLISARQPVPASLLGDFGELNDCHRFDEKTADEAGLSLATSGDVIALGADVHSACVRSELDIVSGRRYEVTFDYRTISGNVARICVWMVGPDRCVDLPDLTPRADWQPYHAEFTLPIAASGGDLFLYADGGDRPDTTRVDFRDVDVIPSPRRFLQLEKSVQPQRDVPVILWDQNSPGAYDVWVGEASGPFAITFTESASANWELGGLPADWDATRLSSNGYSNTWLIDGDGEASLELRFGPNAVASRAQQLSLVAALVALLALGRQAITAFRRDRIRIRTEAAGSPKSKRPPSGATRPRPSRPRPVTVAGAGDSAG